MDAFYVMAIAGFAWLIGWAMGRGYADWRDQRIQRHIQRRLRGHRQGRRRDGDG